MLCFHGALTILVPYIHSRIRAHALSNAWPDAPSSDRRRKAWDLLTRLESTHGVLGLLNFIAFLWDGRYVSSVGFGLNNHNHFVYDLRFRTVADRLLNLRLVPARRLSKHDVSYEFMNRQMVWHAFTVGHLISVRPKEMAPQTLPQEFLLFLLPLINTRALRRWLSRAFAQVSFSSILPAPIRSLVGLTSDSQPQGGAREHRGKYWSLPLDQCAICAEDAATAMNLADPSKTLTSLANNYSTVSVPTEPPIESDNVEEEPPPYPIYNPYFASCGHSYCYVCLAGRMMRAADDRTGVGPGGTRWECLRCGDGVTVVDRVETEVEEVESDFGSTSMNGMDYEEYGSEDMEFTDMSGSMGTYSDSGASE